MGAHDDGERVQLETRADWRAWLEEHHTQGDGVWLVSWRRHTGRLSVGYEDAVEEALCFGWIDSVARPLDGDRSMQWFSPRRKGSTWAGTNKARVERLEAAGLMTDAGRRVIEAAKADGSWTVLDDVEALVVPDDLAAALDARPGSREHWDASTPSARRGALGWIALAKRPETRDRRVGSVADRAARGERVDGQ